ncbi:MAG: tyrosine-type recombinase/integrase [Kiritimatiellia bacterium]|jgi:integrase
MTNAIWPKIRERQKKVNGKLYTYWIVDPGVIDGKRCFRNFTSLKQAEKEATKLRIERNKIGADAVKLTDDQKRQAVEGIKKLGERASITEAVAFYMNHTAPDGGAQSVEDTFAEYLESKLKANQRPLTIRDARQKLQRFVAVFGKSLMHEVTVHDIETWIDDLGFSPVTREGHLRQLRAFFEFGVRREHLKVNPARKIEKAKLDDKIPVIMPVKDVERLLRTAEEEAPLMVPYFALAFFAGLRPTSEIGEMTWDNIDFEERLIRVVPSVAKTRRQRFVDVSDNLLAWLQAYKSNGKMYFSRNEFDRVRKLAKVKWGMDIARHTFGSCYLAKHEDIQKTCLQMGHTRPDMLFTHYRGLCKKTEAEVFWRIQPERKRIQLANVV